MQLLDIALWGVAVHCVFHLGERTTTNTRRQRRQHCRTIHNPFLTFDIGSLLTCQPALKCICRVCAHLLQPMLQSWTKISGDVRLTPFYDAKAGNNIHTPFSAPFSSSFRCSYAMHCACTVAPNSVVGSFLVACRIFLKHQRSLDGFFVSFWTLQHTLLGHVARKRMWYQLQPGRQCGSRLSIFANKVEPTPLSGAGFTRIIARVWVRHLLTSIGGRCLALAPFCEDGG
jgi:hypothetical protein